MPILPSRMLAATAGALLLAGCGKGTDPSKTAPPPIRAVSTAKVITRDSPLYVDEIGTCTAQEAVSIQAQVTGQITQRHFADGADVKKGDLLFTIDPRPYQAALDQAQGALDQAKAKLKLDQINLQRAQDLQTKKVIAPQDFDTAKTTVTTDDAQIESGRRRWPPRRSTWIIARSNHRSTGAPGCGWWTWATWSAPTRPLGAADHPEARPDLHGFHRR